MPCFDLIESRMSNVDRLIDLKEKKKPDAANSMATAKKSKWDQGGLAAANAVARGVAAPGLVTMPTGSSTCVCILYLSSS